ncbi:MAG: RsmF rRNA methyltransferase first C-terminal domain-containing protein [Erysipelotrichaceae bacterium]|nr:RsmF rRNA methyltransferase first C-terminal domain-containing protein [Erysipelotrichaceae bacterium]
MKLPEQFEKRMRELLREEYDAFVASYDKPIRSSIRLNRNKNVSLPNEWNCTPVPWCDTGFYTNPDSRPGKHPYHDAGAFYMQEASAMLPATLPVDVKGKRVLDLCAAPGGKSSQIADRMENTGLLIANEINVTRAHVLSSNMERMGYPNVIVTNETPQRLADKLEGFFDVILVDAPCSGEGMFRKEPQAMEQWEDAYPEVCAKRQKEILVCANRMLKEGGQLVYSTCTFSKEENEDIVEWLICEMGYVPNTICRTDGIRKGISEQRRVQEACCRIFPHVTDGEGHFAASLVKTTPSEPCRAKTAQPANNVAVNAFLNFEKENLNTTYQGTFVVKENELYGLSDAVLLDKLHILRYGIHFGTVEKHGFTPSHAYSHVLKEEDAQRVWNLKSTSDDTEWYLKGNTLNTDLPNGWCLVCTDHIPLGWGKVVNGTIKNHYPKGLRHK